jgi:hypothetical protein
MNAMKPSALAGYCPGNDSPYGNGRATSVESAAEKRWKPFQCSRALVAADRRRGAAPDSPALGFCKSR